MYPRAEAASDQPAVGKQWFVRGYVALIVAVNLFILWSAWEDRSWGAIWLAFIGGPIANGVLFVISLLILAFRHAMGWQTAALGGSAMAILPPLAVGIDLAIIYGMDLSGC